MSNICYDNTSLPIYQYKSKITEMVHQNQVSVIYGDTGMGKTTQIPKYILDARLNNDLIIGISQPWRIAATSMAHRVAVELGCVCGTEVGYAVREDQRSSDSTKIKYMTDDYLLREYHRDKLLTKYGVIMVDEAHERTIWTDLLFGILKNVLMKRTDLKVVVTSAVVITEQFSLYFNGAPILSLESRVYKVVVLYQPIKGNDFVSRAVEIVEKGLPAAGNGEYLVFLPCDEDVDDCCNRLNKIPNISVIKLDESMNSMDHIFTEPLYVARKVIVTTNIAETLFTITTVRVVIDCGVVMETNYDLVTSMLGYGKEVDISKGCADIRRDRAGCKMKGWCYRIYKKDQYDQFLDDRVPEIMRVDLSGLYLRMIDLGLEPDKFDFLERPESDRLRQCEERLQNLEMIDVTNHVTDLGRMLVEVSLDLALGKAMISSYGVNSSNDIVTGFLMMAERNIFQTPRDDISFDEFHDEDGDFFTKIKVYSEFIQSGKTKEWCETKCLHYESLHRLDKVRAYVLDILDRQGNVPKSICASINKDDIKCSLVREFYGNICVRIKDDTYRNCLSNVTMFMDPNSSLFKSRPNVILFHKCIQRRQKPIIYGLLRLDDNLLMKFPHEMEIIKYQFGTNPMPVTVKKVSAARKQMSTKKIDPKPKAKVSTNTSYNVVQYGFCNDFDSDDGDDYFDYNLGMDDHDDHYDPYGSDNDDHDDHHDNYDPYISDNDDHYDPCGLENDDHDDYLEPCGLENDDHDDHDDHYDPFGLDSDDYDDHDDYYDPCGLENDDHDEYLKPCGLENDDYDDHDDHYNPFDLENDDHDDNDDIYDPYGSDSDNYDQYDFDDDDSD